MSPSASWAKSVMPMRTEDPPSPGSPGGRTHSWSLVYFRSSGNTALLDLGCGPGRLSGRSGVGVLRRRQRADGGDPYVAEPPDGDLAADALHVGDESAGEVEGGGQGVRVTDGIDDIGGLEPLPVDDHPTTGGVLHGGLGDDPHLVVDLDHLRARVPELLEAVQQLVRADTATGVGDRDPYPRPLRGQRT